MPLPINSADDANYLTAPDNKLQRFELSDGNGTIIIPLRGKKPDGDLPLTLAPRELGRASPWLVASPGTPCPLLELDINDIYHFDKEGDYNFNVCAAIYKLQPDNKLASRISLPCVTGTVHLNKSQKN